jgi:phosphoserine phosphatase
VSALELLRSEGDRDRPDAVGQLRRDCARLADELLWLRERFDKLQNRVTTELREIRREVDRWYDAQEEEEEET